MKGIFIVGTGRSGTHFTVRLLNGFRNTRDPLGGEENLPILMDIAKAAIHHRQPSASTRDYYARLLAEADGVVLDQHHPNLFFAEHWARQFDGLVFLYPQRPAYQVVASMLRHTGVLKWYRYAQEWRQRTINRIPYPNRFLGLDRYSDIRRLPPHLLCAHRVIAHRRAFDNAKGRMGHALRSVDYEALVMDPLAEFTRVFDPSELAALGEFELLETPRPSSLTKFHDVLSEAQVADIQALENELLSDTRPDTVGT